MSTSFNFLHQNSYFLAIFVLKLSPLINAPFWKIPTPSHSLENIWMPLTCNMTLDNLIADDKELMKSKRQQAIEVAHKKAEKEREEKAKEKREKERYALQQQMKVSRHLIKMIWKLELSDRGRQCDVRVPTTWDSVCCCYDYRIEARLQNYRPELSTHKMVVAGKRLTTSRPVRVQIKIWIQIFFFFQTFFKISDFSCHFQTFSISSHSHPWTLFK